MSEIVEMLKGFAQAMMQNATKSAEKHVVAYFYELKRTLFRFAIEVILALTGIVLVIGGLVILISRYVPIEWVMLVAGLLCLNIVLLTAKFK
jgi:hypothetical protein